MSPVNDAAEVVPFIETADVNAVSHADRDAFGQVNIVCDQERLAIADIDNETLMPRTVFVITQKAADEARDFDPPPIITLGEIDANSPLSAPS